MDHPHVHVWVDERVEVAHSDCDHYDEVHVWRVIVANTLGVVMRLNSQKHSVDWDDDNFEDYEPDGKKLFILVDGWSVHGE